MFANPTCELVKKRKHDALLLHVKLLHLIWVETAEVFKPFKHAGTALR